MKTVKTYNEIRTFWRCLRCGLEQRLHVFLVNGKDIVECEDCGKIFEVDFD